MANCNPPVKGQAFDLSASLFTSSGLITNPGTLTLKISKDFGDWADAHGTGASEEDSTYGQIKIALDTTDMNADVVDVYLKDDTSGCIAYKATIYTCSETRGLAGTALPDAAADAAGGLAISDAGGLDLDNNVKDQIIAYNLDHLCKTTTGVAADGDLSSYVVDGSILSHMMTAGADTSDYAASTDSMEAVRDHIGDGTNLTEAGGDGDHLTEAGGDGDHLTEAGGDGDHLSAIPWNAAWDAEVESECDNAITANSKILAIKKNVVNQIEITEATANTTIREDDSVTEWVTVAAAFASAAGVTTRKKLEP